MNHHKSTTSINKFYVRFTLKLLPNKCFPSYRLSSGLIVELASGAHHNSKRTEKLTIKRSIALLLMFGHLAGNKYVQPTRKQPWILATAKYTRTSSLLR